MKILITGVHGFVGSNLVAYLAKDNEIYGLDIIAPEKAGVVKTYSWDDLDADELYELAKEPEIGYWCGWKPHEGIKDSLFVLHNFLEIKETYAICLKENGKIIGSVGLHLRGQTDMTDKDDECELGYWIGKPYWGNGYVTEACKGIIKHAFNDLHLTAIWCGYYGGNNRSKRVQEKLGFVYHHRTDDIHVSQLNETRVGYVNLLTLEQFKKEYESQINC